MLIEQRAKNQYGRLQVNSFEVAFAALKPLTKLRRGRSRFGMGIPSDVALVVGEAAVGGGDGR